jgi:type I restriction enzyme S subunit
VFNEMFGPSNVNRWPAAAVGDCGRVQLGRQRSPKYQTGQYKCQYLRVANVFEDRIDLSDLMAMDFDQRDFEAYKLEYGDILLNEGQSTELVGRPAMWRGECDRCCFQNTLIRFRANAKVSTPEYALEVFLTFLRTGAFAKVSTKTSNVAHLGAARFERMQMPLPPLSLQARFSEVARSIESQKSRLLGQITELDALFACLQLRAFSGEFCSGPAFRQDASI